MSSLQSIAECIVQIELCVNFLSCLFEIVFDPAIGHRFGIGVQDDVARLIVLVPRLPNASHVDHQLVVAQCICVITFVRRDEFTFGGEHAWQVRVSHEAVLIDFAEQDFHLAGVVHVLREDVFIGWVARRTVDEFIVAVLDEPWQFPEEVPPGVDLGGAAFATIQLVASPVDRAEGHGVEPVGVKQSRLVVVAQDGVFAPPHHQIQTLARIGSVPNDIAQAYDFLDTDRVDVLQNRLQRFEVPVDVADQRSLHKIPRSPHLDAKPAGCHCSLD